MGVKVDFDPPPRFDQSLMSWLGKTVNSVRQGFLKVPGAEWKTGTYNAVFTAVNRVNVWVPFGYTFKSGLPLVTVCVMGDHPAGQQMHIFASATKVDQFILVADTLTGVAVTGVVPVRWFAIIP